MEVQLELNGQPSSHVYENDWAYFEPLHLPACKIIKEMDKFLLIIVKSSPSHFLKRQTIRVTWGSVLSHSEFTVKTVFVIGREFFSEENKQLQNEINIYKDRHYRRKINTESTKMLIKKARSKTLKKYGTSVVCLFIIFLWAVGWTDYIFEKSFSRFEWPPYINVREQVQLELNGQPSSHVYENDWAYFEPLHLPACKIIKEMDKFLLIIVKSSPSHFLKRQTIRVTWGSVLSHSEFTVKTVFVIGREFFSEENKQLQNEINIYKDILVGNYIDNYRNNTLKFLSAVQFSFNYCHQDYTVPYAFFVDDDYLVLVRNLIAEVKKYDMHDRLYMGWRFDTRPFRTRFHKHRVSIAMYPFNRYPPYISAGAVLLSSQTIREMYYAIQHTRLYSYDDVYAGILAKLLKLPIKHNKNMHFWKTAVDAEEAKTLICAHGFEEERLDLIYNEFRTKGIL